MADEEKKPANDNVLKKLIKVFRTNNVIKHHFQGNFGSKPVGTAKAFFKNSYTFGSSVIPAYSAFDRFARYSDYCLAGDTLIATNTTEGVIRLDELVEKFNKGEKINVFSYDHENNKIVLADVSAARMTKLEEIFELILDNGTVIKCTADHKIMLRDGSYKEAQDLQIGSSLMPFKRFEYTHNNDSKKGTYRGIWSFGDYSKPEHVIVAEYKYKKEILRGSGLEVHHKNFIRNDNSIENLELMTKFEHRSYHAKLNNKRFSLPENREKQAKIAKSRWSKDGDLRKNLGEIIQKREKTVGWQKSLGRLNKYNKIEKPGKHNKDRTDQIHFDNANSYKNITFQSICDVYQKGMTLKEISDVFGVDLGVIRKRIIWEGYDSWLKFTETYENHKIVEIRKSNLIVPVYDITVPKYHNFAIDKGVFVSNCEMETMPIISKGLDIYADETTQPNENGNIVEVFSEDKEVSKTLEELFHKILHLNGKNLWKLVRNLCKYGDSFYLIDATENNGVVGLIQMPSNEVEREEGFDKDDPGAIRFRWTAKNNIEIPNAYVAHFRLDGNDLFTPYGQSVIESSRRPWRQIVLLEDAMLAYRITRAAERRVFFLDIGDTPPEDTEEVVNKFNQTLKKQKVVDTQGRIDMRYGATQTIEEDYVIPVRGTESGTRIETLPGGQNIGDIDDVEYIRKNLFASLGIPKAFLTFDENAGSKQTLTQEDIRFARTIARIQEVLMNEMVKIAMIHLYIKNYRGHNLTNFKLKMTNPSTVAELQKNELWRARMDLVQVAGDGVFDTTFIYKNFLKLSDETIDLIRKGQIQDKIYQSKLIAIENSQGAMPGAAGMGGGMGGGLGGGMGMGGMGGGTFGGGGMGGGMGGLGGLGGMAGGEMGAEMPPMQTAEAPSVGEALNPSSGFGKPHSNKKDMSRTSDGNGRHANIRGVSEVPGTSEEEQNYDSDPNDLEGLKRTITHPMGMKEVIENIMSVYAGKNDLQKSDFFDRVLYEAFPSLRPKEVKASTAIISEQLLLETFGEGQTNTKSILTEADEKFDLETLNSFETKLKEITNNQEKVLKEAIEE